MPNLPKTDELRADTAQALMTPTPVHVSVNSSVKQAAILMADHRISALPVLDDADHVVGVIHQSDIIRAEREGTCIISLHKAGELEALSDGLQQSHAGQGRLVDELMIPIVYSVSPEMAPEIVIKQMLRHEIHRVFVIDIENHLVGVITTFDIIKHMQQL